MPRHSPARTLLRNLLLSTPLGRDATRPPRGRRTRFPAVEFDAIDLLIPSFDRLEADPVLGRRLARSVGGTWPADPRADPDAITRLRQLVLARELGSWKCARPSPPRFTGPLRRHVDLLVRALGLDPLDGAIVVVIHLFSAECELRELSCHYYESLSLPAAAVVLGAALAVEPRHVESRLLPGAPLIESAVVHVAPQAADFCDKLRLNEAISNLLDRPRLAERDLFAAFAPLAAPPELSFDAFPNLQQEAALAARLLRAALTARARGVNVLLHGPPEPATYCFISLRG